MPFCQNCGASVEEAQEVCLKCGRSTKANLKNNATTDSGGFGWGLLGFCIPLVGLILYLVWNNDRPNTAKAAGLGALIGFGSGILLYIFFIAIAASL